MAYSDCLQVHFANYWSKTVTWLHSMKEIGQCINFCALIVLKTVGFSMHNGQLLLELIGAMSLMVWMDTKQIWVICTKVCGSSSICDWSEKKLVDHIDSFSIIVTIINMWGLPENSFLLVGKTYSFMKLDIFWIKNLWRYLTYVLAKKKKTYWMRLL